MIYNEGYLDAETLEFNLSSNDYRLNADHLNAHHNSYWKPYTHSDLRMAGINPDWKLCMHFIINTSYFMELGGYDCEYEYSNHALHDLVFRAQHNGSVVHFPSFIAFFCSHYPGQDGDHGPIHDAQTGPDLKRFNDIYSKPNAVNDRVKLDYNGWKNKEYIWTRRFNSNNLQVHK